MFFRVVSIILRSRGMGSLSLIDDFEIAGSA